MTDLTMNETPPEHDVDFLADLVKFIRGLPDCMEKLGDQENYIAGKFTVYIDTVPAVAIEWDAETEQWITNFTKETR